MHIQRFDPPIPRSITEDLPIDSREALKRLMRINNAIESQKLSNASTEAIKRAQDTLGRDLDLLPDIKIVNNIIDKNLVAIGKELERRGEPSAFANLLDDPLTS